MDHEDYLMGSHPRKKSLFSLEARLTSVGSSISMTRNSSRAQVKLPCSISLYLKGFLLVKESLVTLANPSQTISNLSLVTYLSYTKNISCTCMKASTQDLGMNPRTFTQEPKSIGSVAQLTECPSLGWSIRQSRV